MIYYFAYGSNLHPVRLKKRVPSAELVGVAKHPNYRLAFHKKSNDESGKCNMFNSNCKSDLIYGAIYRLKPEDKDQLDILEGRGYGYIEKTITLEYNGAEYNCFTYIAEPLHIVDRLKPYHWYKKLVVEGAKYLKFPDYYIASIEAVKSIDDFDHSRIKSMDKLIEQIVN